MSVSLEQYNTLVDLMTRLVERVTHLETLLDSDWASRFTPAKGPIAPPSRVEFSKEEEQFAAGGHNLMQVLAATEEGKVKNCIFFNTGKEEDSKVKYFANTKNMKLVKAVYDPELEPGTLRANLLTRLNLDLPLNEVCDFLKMAGPVACSKVVMRVASMAVFQVNTIPVDDIKKYLDGVFVNSNRDNFVVRANGAHAKVLEISGEGIITKDTEIVLA
jgi:hypothetical protein